MTSIMLHLMLFKFRYNYHDSKMSFQNENFGMMDEAYFVPRTEILDWLNNLLHLNLTKIQQLGSGAVYCQVVDVIHPGKVALSKVNWKAKNDYEFINNLKILQNSFDKVGIKKHLEIQRLAKARYQDNLELIQWFKRYFDLNCGERGNNYLPEERRGNAAVDFSFAEKNVVPKTYGGSGVVKSQVFEKKKPSVKSPPTKKPEIKKTTSPLKGNIKSTATTISSKPTKEEAGQKIQESEQENKKLIEQLTSQYHEKIEALENEQEQLKSEIMGQKQNVKHTQMKIDMIKEILKGEDEAIMKISLIEQIIHD